MNRLNNHNTTPRGDGGSPSSPVPSPHLKKFEAYYSQEPRAPMMATFRAEDYSHARKAADDFACGLEDLIQVD